MTKYQNETAHTLKVLGWKATGVLKFHDARGQLVEVPTFESLGGKLNAWVYPDFTQYI